MQALKAKSFELRQAVLDMIMQSGGGHIGGDFSVMEIQIGRASGRERVWTWV